MDTAVTVLMDIQVGIRLSGSLSKKSNRQLPNFSHTQEIVLKKEGVLFNYKGPFLKTGGRAVVVTQCHNLNLTGVYFTLNIRGSDGIYRLREPILYLNVKCGSLKRAAY